VTAAEILLTPLAAVYGAAARLRALAYERGIFPVRRLPGPVISVGNLTTGGTGKTPMVIWIAERLAAEGKRVGILTRGHRGEKSGAAGRTSDEVRMMNSRLGDAALFGVGPDRYEQGVHLARRGVEWFVLDDGFQHMKLGRNVNIALVDATNPFGGNRLLPAGRLREPRPALRRADIIVVTRSGHAPQVEAVVRRETAAPIFYAETARRAVRKISGDGPEVISPDDGEQRWFAFSGIGNPNAFVENLKVWGFQVAGQSQFPDHHRYSAADLREIASAAAAAGAGRLICTEKDKFNLPVHTDFGMPAYFCEIATAPTDEAGLWKAILDCAAANRRGARNL
jgi:tetraacyldisaccharide 4'-kinase